jgi:hypothetical protein
MMDQKIEILQGDYAAYIARALATEGGHLAIGRGGFTLWFGPGATFSGYDIEPMKNACIKVGLPVIDSRMVDFGVVARLAINGPLVAVGQAPDEPPYHAFSNAPLAVVAQSYREAGALMWNLDSVL